MNTIKIGISKQMNGYTFNMSPTIKDYISPVLLGWRIIKTLKNLMTLFL